MLFHVLPYTDFDPALLVYIIPGKPIPLQRPRYSMAHIYDAQKREKYIAAIHVANCHGDLPAYTGMLVLNIDFYFPTPSKNKKLEGDFHSGKPDLDNLVKWVCDVAQNAGIYKNDSCISQIVATKLYAKEPRTEFTIKKIK